MCISMMPQEQKDATDDDDEDDFFGNPLKHLMSKVMNAKKSGNEIGTTTRDRIKKKGIHIHTLTQFFLCLFELIYPPSCITLAKYGNFRWV